MFPNDWNIFLSGRIVLPNKNNNKSFFGFRVKRLNVEDGYFRFDPQFLQQKVFLRRQTQIRARRPRSFRPLPRSRLGRARLRTTFAREVQRRRRRDRRFPGLGRPGVTDGRRRNLFFPCWRARSRRREAEKLVGASLLLQPDFVGSGGTLQSFQTGYQEEKNFRTWRRSGKTISVRRRKDFRIGLEIEQKFRAPRRKSFIPCFTHPSYIILGG